MICRSSLVVEHSLGKGEVEGSIPSYGTIFFELLQKNIDYSFDLN